MKFVSYAALGALALSSQLVAQTTAAYHSYGFGCASCVKSNEDAQTNPAKSLRQGALPNEYCYGFTAPSNLTIHGFAMFTQATGTAPFTMTTALYQQDAATATQPGQTAVGSGTMTADTSVGWYVTKFASPVKVASGDNFWVSGVDSSNILASSVVGGAATTLPIYWRRTGTGTTWSRTGIISNPGIVIFCEGTPILSASSAPKIPSPSFSIDICNTAPSSPCVLVFGASDSVGPLGPLPSDLGMIGFPGCVLWCSDDFYAAGVTTATNDFSWKFPIPNNPAFDGLTFYAQSYVNSASSGVSFSNAGKLLTGTL